jgi:hypothetical protein
MISGCPNCTGTETVPGQIQTVPGQMQEVSGAPEAEKMRSFVVRNLGRYTFITGALTVLVIPFSSAQTNERADQVVSEQVQAQSHIRPATGPAEL